MAEKPPRWVPTVASLRSLGRGKLALGLAGVLLVGGAAVFSAFRQPSEPKDRWEISSQSRKGLLRYTPTEAEWASLTTAPAKTHVFRGEHVTEGKIAVNEDRSTQVFSPYAGRVTKLLAKPGDHVEQGQALFVIEAADTVQAQNDFIAAATALNKAKSQLELAQTQDK
ncbi:MAG: efflux RND transporter periplasmic adaptor subunit, partial [Rhizobiales bacterium]|nr:efflux RND transporter periplasmic adaptor subunit [Hyphomicrobiales bacterium]